MWDINLRTTAKGKEKVGKKLSPSRAAASCAAIQEFSYHFVELKSSLSRLPLTSILSQINQSP
jgi:hypothetical protein